MNPKSDYLLINTKGAQFTKLTEAMGKLVYEAIGKYVNPTRYRQIIETESSENLEQHEREWVTEDQKHSSKVARVCYQKRKSRDVALKGEICLKKLKGEEGVQVEKSLLCLLSDDELEKEFSQSSNILDDDTLKHDTVGSGSSSIECDEHESNVNLQLQASNKKFKLETTGNAEKRASRSHENKSSRGQFQNKDVTKKKISFTPEEDENLQKGSEQYGRGNWTCIWRDPDLKFADGRSVIV